MDEIAPKSEIFSDLPVRKMKKKEAWKLPYKP
jgi:hypothetical protein